VRVRSRTPLRLGLAGGGTDVSPYSDRFGGLVLNVTIDKYAYATIAASDAGKIRLVAADNGVEWQGDAVAVLEQVAGLELHVGVYNRIVRDYNNGKPLAVTITTYSDAPPGSGLGSSSAIVVALVQAFCEYLRIPLGKYDIAHLAYEIERIDLKLAGGKQDQYAAAFGGFNFMEFYADNRVIVNPLRIEQAIKAELESSFILFYTGVSRESANIIEQQIASIADKNTAALEALHQVRAEALKMKEAILKGEIKKFALSMQSTWESKKQTAKSISNTSIDRIYNAALEAGALAGKVSGAGGGGFMMFITEPTLRSRVMQKLQEFSGQIFNCNFTEQGAYSWKVDL
jgi:D-glycero-alpha-D-manno-heptose-7-phosphate kinase